MVLDQDWGVAVERIRAFFREQPDVEATEDGFRYGDCRIALTAAEGNLGSLVIPRTRLRIEGPEEQVQVIHSRIFLRFLSAGG